MFTALTLSMALGAPVPPPAAPVATGTAPRVMELKPNTDGKILVAITRQDKQKVAVAGGAAVLPGNARPAVLEREINVSRSMTVELGEVKDLTITTADGKKLDLDDAKKKLEKGAIVVISADGSPVSPAYLKVFKDDTLVLVSKELAGPQVGTGVSRPGIRPLPAIQPGGVQILPVQGGAVQIQIQPGVIQVAPAIQPAIPVKPAVPPKPEK